MNRERGFDWLPEAQRRMKRQEMEDSWKTIAIHGLCFVVLCAAMVAVSLGWIPHG